jgi:transcriptional regulator with XRE-family HTH domain
MVGTTFGQRLRELRRERSLTQEDLSRRTRIHAPTIGRLERDKREPRLKTILRLADGLGVSPGELLDDLAWRQLTPEEFEEHFGDLPTDGDG